MHGSGDAMSLVFELITNLKSGLFLRLNFALSVRESTHDCSVLSERAVKLVANFT